MIATDNLVEHARLGEREFALVDAFLQEPDALRVKTIEAPHRGDALGEPQV